MFRCVSDLLGAQGKGQTAILELWLATVGCAQAKACLCVPS